MLFTFYNNDKNSQQLPISLMINIKQFVTSSDAILTLVNEKSGNFCHM